MGKPSHGGFTHLKKLGKLFGGKKLFTLVHKLIFRGHANLLKTLLSKIKHYEP